MKKLRKHIRFHKMDEMEKYIAIRAKRNSYLFLVVALLVWSLYESCQVYVHHTRLNLIPCLLLTGAAAIQALSQLIMTRSAVKDDEDSCETAPLFKIIVLLCAVAGVAATVSAAVLLTAVRV